MPSTNGLHQTTHTSLANRRKTNADYEFLTPQQVKDSPGIEWIIEEFLPVNGFSMFYGPSKSFKSFVALDLALSVAGGTEFIGREVRQGSVVYLSGEGIQGLRNRILAWEIGRGRSAPEDLLFWTRAIQVHSLNEVDEFIRKINERMPTLPSLIVFDTLARCFVGGKENEAEDMGKFIRGVDRIRDNIGANVLVVHHTPRQKEDAKNPQANTTPRGSYALTGALDSEFRFFRAKKDGKDGPDVRIKCTKQKEAEEMDEFTMTQREVSVGNNQTSLVIDSQFTALLPIDKFILSRLKAAGMALGWDELKGVMRNEQAGMYQTHDKKLRARLNAIAGWGYITVRVTKPKNKKLYEWTGREW